MSNSIYIYIYTHIYTQAIYGAVQCALYTLSAKYIDSHWAGLAASDLLLLVLQMSQSLVEN